MRKIIALLVLAVGLAGCDMIGTLIDGLKHVQAVEADLAQATGLQPQVSFNWHNGRLRLVTVTFPGLYEAKPLDDVAKIVRAAVDKEFQQTPDNIVLGFSLGNAPAGQPVKAEPISY